VISGSRGQFLDDIRAQKIGAAVERLGKALMVMHSRRRIVDIDNAARIFIAANIRRATYRSIRPTTSSCAARTRSTRARSSPPGLRLRRPSPEAAPALPAGAVLVRETRVGKFTQSDLPPPHVIHADEPLEAGGLDTGLSPYDLLCASLGACTAMTLRSYAA